MTNGRCTILHLSEAAYWSFGYRIFFFVEREREKKREYNGTLELISIITFSIRWQFQFAPIQILMNWSLQILHMTR